MQAAPVPQAPQQEELPVGQTVGCRRPHSHVVPVGQRMGCRRHSATWCQRGRQTSCRKDHSHMAPAGQTMGGRKHHSHMARSHMMPDRHLCASQLLSHHGMQAPTRQRDVAPAAPDSDFDEPAQSVPQTSSEESSPGTTCAVHSLAACSWIAEP